MESVRARLALWHTAVVAALLGAFATAGYLILSDTVHRRADRFLEESARAFAADIVAERADEASNAAAIHASVFEFHFRDLTFVVYDAAGRVVGASLARDAVVVGERGAAIDTAAMRRVASSARSSGSASAPGTRFTTIPDREGGVRVLVLPLALRGEPVTIAAAESLHDEAELLRTVRRSFAVAIPIALLAAWAGGYGLARRSLAPVVAMSDRAAAIGASSLGDRLPVANPRDELGQLAQTFNSLLGRMSEAFEQQRRFMSDASHELRTPVAIMRGEADVALSRADRPAEEYRDALGVVRDEGRRLSGIVNDLFLLARADAGRHPLRAADLYLDDLLGDCTRAMRSLAARRDVQLSFEPPAADGDDYALHADEDLLRRLFLNLLDNAIKHSGTGASVRLTLARAGGVYRVTVSDSGPGIPEEARAHVFERFYRVETARSRAGASDTGGGAGLGLAIARWIAESHGGALELTESSPAGTTFTVTLAAPVRR